MKNRSKSKKVALIIIALILIAGIIMLFAKGFQKDINYQSATRIEFYIPQGYEKTDIQQIVSEVFSDKNLQIQEVEKLNQIVSIRIKNYNAEELETFKTKIAEKYGIEKDNLDLHEVPIPSTKISTIVSPYIIPVSLVTILSIVYVAIKNIKEKDMGKKVVKILINLIIVAGLYFSIILITQMPVNQYTMPIALALYVATLLITVIKINKD